MPEIPDPPEATPKRYKAVIALGAVIFVFGLAVFFLSIGGGDQSHRENLGASIVLMLFGMIVLLIGKIGAWWNYG